MCILRDTAGMIADLRGSAEPQDLVVDQARRTNFCSNQCNRRIGTFRENLQRIGIGNDSVLQLDSTSRDQAICHRLDNFRQGRLNIVRKAFGQSQRLINLQRTSPFSGLQIAIPAAHCQAIGFTNDRAYNNFHGLIKIRDRLSDN